MFMSKAVPVNHGMTGKLSGAGMLVLSLLVISGCTTTTRSVHESPRDPGMERTSSSRLQAQQLAALTQTDIDNLLIRNRTTTSQIVQLFGRPQSMTQSGDEQYWNYTEQFRDERRQVGGLKSLTILVNPSGLVVDYDFQDNTFSLQP